MPTQFMARSVAAEITLHGQRLRTGQGVLLLYASANRDDREYAVDESRLEFRRADQIHGLISMPIRVGS